ncbi:hypothetical protein [Paenibacillus sp. MZ03-122A]|uniref:hypothetical protein n=1 Tax=Paenibacillus sp. MZ03-122A TaxID=2962033 RepID=UPI0020B6EDA0|nr:hypothetical protein [Paenibacillus sp. MZ03-122A]MCP3780919.1 hypothetical protein [Paenibacillus sp. MZ03-122A]
MNPAIKRSREKLRNNIGAIINKADILYADFEVDILDDRILLTISGQDEHAAKIVKEILITNQPIKHLYNQAKYNEVLKILKEVSQETNNLLRKLKRERTNKNKALKEEDKVEMAESLEHLSKKYLIKIIIKYFSIKQIDKLRQIADKKKKEKEKNLNLSGEE